MSLGNITSANAVIVMTVEDLFPAGVRLEQFATDQALDGDDHEYAQARMGVDGQLAAGSWASRPGWRLRCWGRFPSGR